MNQNPFQPTAIEASSHDESRMRALKQFRLATSILTLPAALNYYFWDLSVIEGRYAVDITWLLRAGNLLGLVLLIGFIWFFGLQIINSALSLLPPVRRDYDEQWRMKWHAALARLPAFAALGGILWSIWVICFFHFDFTNFAFMVLCSILGHAIAAYWYLPLVLDLFFRWLRQRKERSGIPN